MWPMARVAAGLAKRVPLFIRRPAGGQAASAQAKRKAAVMMPGKHATAGKHPIIKAAVPAVAALVLVPSKFLSCAVFMAFFPRVGKLLVSTSSMTSAGA